MSSFIRFSACPGLCRTKILLFIDSCRSFYLERSTPIILAIACYHDKIVFTLSRCYLSLCLSLSTHILHLPILDSFTLDFLKFMIFCPARVPPSKPDPGAIYPPDSHSHGETTISVEYRR